MELGQKKKKTRQEEENKRRLGGNEKKEKRGGGECRHASIPGHQLCEGRKRRKERRRRRKSGEGGREQHHTSRSYIGGARADAAGKQKNKEGSAINAGSVIF